MAEANGICDLPTEQVQSILEGHLDNDSQRSLPQVPNESIGLSSIRQNLSSSFNCLRRGITSSISRNTNQPQTHVEMEVDAEQLSPTSLRTQLAAYQNTVRDLHNQNKRNAEWLRQLEAIVTEKDLEISHLQIEETQKDLRIQVQRDFQDQLVMEQTACQQVNSTLEVLWQELEALRSKQNGHNPMNISSTTDTNNELNRKREKVEEEKWILAEKLAKTQADYEQALKDKKSKITLKIEHIKKNMEDQMRKEREQV